MPTIADRRPIATGGRLGARLRRALAGAALAVFALVGTAAAQQRSVYTVSGVPADATAEAAAAAREIALAQAHAAAFRRLIARLVPQEWEGRVPTPKPDALARLIADFEVQSEKTSTVRYIARLDVRFDRRAVRALLRRAGVPFAEAQRPPALLLPVYRWAGATLLWDRPNPWREAWEALPPIDGLAPIVRPKGDLQDVADIGPNQALRGEPARVATIAGRYGAGAALVAAATLKTDAARNRPILEVEASLAGDAGSERPISLTFPAGEDETVAALLARAAATTAETYAERWKSANLLSFDQPGTLVVRAPVGGLAELVRLRQAIDSLAVVDRSALISLTRTAARLRLDYVGGPEQLARVLDRNGLTLHEEGDGWELRSNDSAARAAAH